MSEGFEREECTEQEELYAQHRAMGYTKTKAATKAYPNSKYPKQAGYEAELRECVKNRIRELKEERAESAGLDVHEQVRRYNELYLSALEKGQLVVAKQMLERIDAIGGFDAPSKSISLKGNIDESSEVLKGHNIEEDLKKFSSVLSKHSEDTQKDDTDTLH